MTGTSSLNVFVTDAEAARQKALPKGHPPHWNDDTGVGFNNPWASFGTRMTFLSWDFLSFFTKGAWQMARLDTDKAKKLIPITKPTWSAQAGNEANNVRATWLGHACFFVQMPNTSSSRGANILFDPVFSDRCAPSQHIGPKRFTPPPCSLEDIPEVDAIVISHNHYDHLDTDTITTLAKRKDPPHVFAPLGNEPYFMSLGIPKSHIHVLDWWQSLRVESKKPNVDFAIDITCTPCQHLSGRGIRDQCQTLWSSWVVEGVGANKGKVYFAGDTGYRRVKDASKLDDESLPFCPVFKEIGERWNGFDLAMIPIGAYQPRLMMSGPHASPPQSVHIFKDIRARNALGMHWGTWALTTEDVMEPPKLLKESLERHQIPQDRFQTCGIGETRTFNVEEVQP